MLKQRKGIRAYVNTWLIFGKHSPLWEAANQSSTPTLKQTFYYCAQNHSSVLCLMNALHIQYLCTLQVFARIIFIHSFCHLLYEGYRLFQIEFSKECQIVLPLVISSIPSFPEYHPVALYLLFLVSSSLISFPLCFFQ